MQISQGLELSCQKLKTSLPTIKTLEENGFGLRKLNFFFKVCGSVALVAKAWFWCFLLAVHFSVFTESVTDTKERISLLTHVALI
jgi:hypothetical protein